MTPTQQLLKREYGASVYGLAQRLLTLDDREDRSRQAQLVVNLMVKTQPELRDQQDLYERLWHHLLMMAAGQLDVDVPYDLPPVGPDDLASTPPKRMLIRMRPPKQRHYGRHIEALVKEAVRLEDPAEREAALLVVGRLMKAFYRTYNKDQVSDKLIIKHMEEIAEQRIADLQLERIERDRLFDSQLVAGNGPGQPLNDSSPRRGGGGGGGKGGKKGGKRRKR